MLGKLQFSRRQGRGRAGQGKVDSRVTQATELVWKELNGMTWTDQHVVLCCVSSSADDPQGHVLMYK